MDSGLKEATTGLMTNIRYRSNLLEEGEFLPFGQIMRLKNKLRVLKP
jgi:hypothetical protein